MTQEFLILRTFYSGGGDLGNPKYFLPAAARCLVLFFKFHYFYIIIFSTTLETLYSTTPSPPQTTPTHPTPQPKFFQHFQALAEMLPEWQQNIFFKFFQIFQAIAKMLPEWQQNMFFEIFQLFQALAKMLPEWQQNVFFNFFQNFQRLPKCCHNGIKFCFQNYPKFSDAAQNVAIMATFLFF